MERYVGRKEKRKGEEVGENNYGGNIHQPKDVVRFVSSGWPERFIIRGTDGP